MVFRVSGYFFKFRVPGLSLGVQSFGGLGFKLGV